MAISSPGLGSGLDINSIVSQLVAVEQQPIKLLQSKGSKLQTQLSVFGQVKSELAALQDAASALMSASTWDSKTFSSSNTNAVTGTASSSALSSSFSLSVTSLAQGQSLKTGAVPSGYTANASGKLTIQLGSWNAAGTSFVAGITAAVDINVTEGDSLATIAAAINAKSGTAGVSATVVAGTSGQQLLIRSTATGVASGFQITSTTTSTATGFTPPGLERFVYPTVTTTPPETDGLGAPVPSGMSSIQPAADAAFTVDGIAVTSATNTATDVIPGVTLNLLDKTTSAVTIKLDTDKTAIKAKIQAFQDAYNKLYADLKTQTAYNAATKTGGPLLGDSTTTGLQNMLRTLVGANGPATSTIKRLSDLGLQVQADGSLSTNSSKLDAALQDPANVKAFFAASTGTASGDGIARRIYDFAFGANSTGGNVSAHSAAFQKAIDQNSKAIDKLNAHITDYQKQLLSRYTALDKQMSSLNSLSTYVTQQVAQWNKTG